MPKPIKITKIYIGGKHIATTRLYDTEKLDRYLFAKKKKRKKEK